jgi:hypothetical protein
MSQLATEMVCSISGGARAKAEASLQEIHRTGDGEPDLRTSEA